MESWVVSAILHFCAPIHFYDVCGNKYFAKQSILGHLCWCKALAVAIPNVTFLRLVLCLIFAVNIYSEAFIEAARHWPLRILNRPICTRPVIIAISWLNIFITVLNSLKLIDSVNNVQVKASAKNLLAKLMHLDSLMQVHHVTVCDYVF